MGRNKILCSIFMGLSFCFLLGSGAKASNNFNSEILNFSKDEFNYVDILGKKYDLSYVNPSVVQAVIRVFDDINSLNLVGEDKNQKLMELSKILDEYFLNPESFENFPTTLDLSPSSLLREEISYVQSKISEIEDKNEIEFLRSWINYSVVNFNSSDYKRTFLNEDLENREIFSSVYSTLDFETPFRIIINSDGSFKIQNGNISGDELLEIIKWNLEFENYKATYLRNEMKNLNSEDEILNLEREIESVKAYGVSQEIVLLNLQKEIVKNTKISKEFMEEKLLDLDEKINKRVEILKNFNLNNYTDFEFGNKHSYFGYHIETNENLGFELDLDENGVALVNGVYEISDENKSILKSEISKEIKNMKEEISNLEYKKGKINSNGYYLLDAIEKRIIVLRNHINNYEILLPQI